MAIKIFFNRVSVALTERKRLKQFITNIFKLEGKELFYTTYIFCTDKFLLSINQEFLQHNDYTDIITFTLSDPIDPIVGEIYISAERIKDNAKQLQISRNKEIHRVIFHGALHLCGYNDKTPVDKIKMTQKEDKYLKMYFD